MSVPKLQVTKNYRLFTKSADNRPANPKKHKRLQRSLEKYGFLPCFPLACVRDKNNNLVVFDGQHRLLLAETLGLVVYFVVIETAFNIAAVNCTQEKWVARNFAETYAQQGKKHYIAGLEFADRFKLPVGCAFGLLGGTVSWNNVAPDYWSGDFVIKDQPYAETVGSIYSHIIHVAPAVKNARLLEACMAVARVKSFDAQRLLQGVDRCREKLVSYSTRDAYLAMLEEIYNFGRKNLVSLKNETVMIMRERHASLHAHEQKKAKQGAAGTSAALVQDYAGKEVSP